MILKDAMMPPPPDFDVIARELKDSTGKDQFERFYAKLVALNLGKDDLIKVAKIVYGAKPQRATKDSALQAIRKLHDISVRTRRGLELQGGRSAA